MPICAAALPMVSCRFHRRFPASDRHQHFLGWFGGIDEALPMLCRNASIRATTFSPRGRALAVTGFPVRLLLMSSISAVSYWSSNFVGSDFSPFRRTQNRQFRALEDTNDNPLHIETIIAPTTWLRILPSPVFHQQSGGTGRASLSEPTNKTASSSVGAGATGCLSELRCKMHGRKPSHNAQGISQQLALLLL
jgi:hypothetical protein